jgi:fumarate hydratase class II
MTFIVNHITGIWIRLRKRYYTYQLLIAKRKITHAYNRHHRDYNSWASNIDRGYLLPWQESALQILANSLWQIHNDIDWLESI